MGNLGQLDLQVNKDPLVHQAQVADQVHLVRQGHPDPVDHQVNVVLQAPVVLEETVGHQGLLDKLDLQAQQAHKVN